MHRDAMTFQHTSNTSKEDYFVTYNGRIEENTVSVVNISQSTCNIDRTLDKRGVDLHTGHDPSHC